MINLKNKIYVYDIDSHLQTKCYIYCIRNTVNNKRYIGSSIRVLTRKRVHFQKLRDNKHPNKKLQRSYNKYGSDKFIFEILEEFNTYNKKDQFVKEQYYIDLFKSFKKGFNCTSNAAWNGFQAKLSPEQLRIKGQKISNLKKGIRPKNYNEMIKTRWRPIEELENGVVIKEYINTRQAGISLGIDYRLIHNVLKNKVKTTEKFPHKTWRYKND